MLTLTPYARDANSFAIYLRNPEAIAVHFQRTEGANCLLDVELGFQDEEAGKVLLRLEGQRREMQVLAHSILEAVEHPRLHPAPEDLLEDALLDRSNRPEIEQTVYAESRQTKGREVEAARRRLQHPE